MCLSKFEFELESKKKNRFALQAFVFYKHYLNMCVCANLNFALQARHKNGEPSLKPELNDRQEIYKNLAPKKL